VNKKINYDKVASAAERVKNRGEEPSLTNISKELGILSHPPELSSLLQEWYGNQPEFQDLLTNNLKLETNKIFEKNIELEKSLSLLRATLESTADGIMMVNGKGQVIDWNQKFVEMWRIPSYMLESGTESIGFEYILEQLSNPESVVADVQYLYENPEWQGELPLLHFKDGRIFERFTQPQRVGSEIVGRVYSFRDMTQRLMSEDELRIRERAIEASTHGVIIIDITKENQPIIYKNKAFEYITGYTQEQTVGQNLSLLQGKNTDEISLKRIALAIKERCEETVELECYRRNGEMFWCELSVAPVSDSFKTLKHYVCIINDITKRREMEKQLILQATHDSLTGLPNRVLLMDRVEQAILKSKKKNGLLAFLFLDIDRFKMTNDTLGHSIGDKLLQAISNLLLIATNDFDTVARLGGDEFVILLPELSSPQQAKQIAQKILNIIEKPIRIDQHSLKVTGSIGISYYPKDGLNYESLLKSADLSMYQAKDSGRNSYRVFEQEMNIRVINHMQLENALHDALKKNEFYLVYHPIIDLKKESIMGFEALIRWTNHLLGEVEPSEFLGVAEENGLIIDIGKWVLEQACTQMIDWHKQGYGELSIAVNISSKQFRQPNFPDMVSEVLQNTGLSAEFLKLELTESMLIDDIDFTVERMNQLKKMGIKLVIDDFGTGYSSLSYLEQFPIDILKIDKSFITELVNKENDASIAQAVIILGHTLNLEVLAEGVETKLQKEFIDSHGCDYAQGYYFKSPTTADLLEDYLKNFPKHL
jgi:diguanylate cyclase (GGDEF)-like protein/PAS domain S-box-containing protein